MRNLLKITFYTFILSFIFASCGSSDAESTTEDSDTNYEYESISNGTNSEETGEESEGTGEESEETDGTEEEASSECDDFIADYENFVDNYVAIVKKMKSNPSDLTIMSEYTSMASNLATMQSDASDCTDSKYASLLLKLNAKLASAAAGM